MKKNGLKIGLLIFAITSASSVYAEYVGKNSGQNSMYNTVKSILDSPVDDRQISLIGNIVEKVSHEKYLFSDGTATIRVDIDDEKFPIQSVDGTTKLKIYGDIEKDFLESPEIDVDFVEIVK